MLHSGSSHLLCRGPGPGSQGHLFYPKFESLVTLTHMHSCHQKMTFLK